jgi:hypothetical protein
MYLFFVGLSLPVVAEETLHAVVEKTTTRDFILGDPQTLPENLKMKLVLMDTLMTGYNEAGDPFDATILEDVKVHDKVMIPKGSLVHGQVELAEAAKKRFSLRGHLTLNFQTILLPDGRQVVLNSQIKQGDSLAASAGRVALKSLGGVVFGAFQGVVTSFKLGGLQAAALSNGASLFAGAGLGALTGSTRGMFQSGKDIVLEEGTELEVSLKGPVVLPSFEYSTPPLQPIASPSLNILVTGIQIKRDPFKTPNLMELTLSIENRSSWTFNTLDFALVDDQKNSYYLSAFGEQADEYIVSLPPHTRYQGHLTFTIKTPQLNHYLVVYKPFTREIVARTSAVGKF